MPVFLIIALGATMKYKGFPGAGFWDTIDRAVYFVFFPSLLFVTLSQARLETTEVLPMALSLGAAQLTMAALVTFVRRPLSLTGPEFSSVFQGTVRWNSFVALASAQSLFGTAGATLTAVGIAVLVPLANILSVYTLTRHATDTPASLGQIAKTLARNPLIIACFLGITVNGLGLELPTFLVETLRALGRATLTLGLIAVGGGLVFANILGNKLTVTVTTVLKLFTMPIITFGFCTLFEVSGLMLTVAMICASVPGATSSYVLARQLGGDATLMASLITASTIVALISMPVIVSLI